MTDIDQKVGGVGCSVVLAVGVDVVVGHRKWSDCAWTGSGSPMKSVVRAIRCCSRLKGATAEETGGAFLLFEDHMAGGKVTPLHTHPDADEAFYVLEGEIVVHVDGDEHKVGPGGFAVAPRGVPHAFLVTSEGTRVLCLQTPGTGQAFFRQASDPTSDDAIDGPVDFARVQAAAQQHGGVEILGPPPFSTTH